MGYSTGSPCCEAPEPEADTVILEQNGWTKHDETIVAGRNDFSFHGWQYLQGGGENYAYVTSDNRITYLTLQENTPGNWTCGYYVCSYPQFTASDLNSIIAGVDGQVVHFSSTQAFTLNLAGIDQEATMTFAVNGASNVLVSIRGYVKPVTNVYIDSTGSLNLTIYRGPLYDPARSPKVFHKTSSGTAPKLSHSRHYHDYGAIPKFTGTVPAGTFYFMYSANIIPNRFVNPSSRYHSILVNLNAGVWSYLTATNTWTTFTPVSNDFLLSQVNPTTGVVIVSYENNFGTISGLAHGWIGGSPTGQSNIYHFANNLTTDYPLAGMVDWTWSNRDFDFPDTYNRDVALSCSGGSFAHSIVEYNTTPDFGLFKFAYPETADYARPFLRLIDPESDTFFPTTPIVWATGPFDDDYNWPIKNMDMSVGSDTLPQQEFYYPREAIWHTKRDDLYPPPLADAFLTEAHWTDPETLDPIVITGASLPIIQTEQRAEYRYTPGSDEVIWHVSTFYVWFLSRTGTDGSGDYTENFHVRAQVRVDGAKFTGSVWDFNRETTSDTDSAPLQPWLITSAYSKQWDSGGSVSGTVPEAETQLHTLLDGYAGTIINVTMDIIGTNTP